MRAAAAAALGRMASAVADDAGRVGIDTAYRSYATQDALYDKWLARRGRTWTDTWYARPGYSEHQTGLAVDLVTPASPACDFEACFADTSGGRWLARNAWRYGFVVRYQPDNEAVTGYTSEPWHLRFVGRALAGELRDAGVSTLEEFFDVPGGDYPDG